MSVRVRFAPSPTGPLHIGGVRTALYNYLFARKMGGKMLLRIEDTDQTRYVPGAEEYILEALSWIGINIDEGQGVGGPDAPYRQSERKAIYRQYADQLLASGKAYYAFDTADELEEMRKKLEEAKVDNTSYNAVTRMQMKNSLTLPKEEVEARIAKGDPYVIRLKVPLKEEIRFKDIIREWVVVHSSTIDDKVLLKSDGMPTYHLANIVDDHLMGITHVIRGEEWLPSAPLHILLYRAFGWQAPEFAHLPLLLKPEGNGKLSKRDGLLGNFPVFPLKWTDPFTSEEARGFREDGYFPEALINFLAFLGWNPGTEQEIFSMDELIESFSLEKIHKAGARFMVDKAKWFNQHYLKEKSDEELANIIQLPAGTSAGIATKLVKLMKDRVTFPQEIVTEVPYIFATPAAYDEEVAKSKWNDDAKKAMSAIKEAIQSMAEEQFVAQQIHDTIFPALEAAGLKPGKVMQAFRLSITGVGKGPDLMLILEILGKAEVIARIEKAIVTLG
ncbi:glutamate--tRNA ligase [Emticicia sp. 21SJ11W-3]|uniref:glutamate--tRNA ligase n=1 Tax=Emticicia sp. 21SJ11W-3 TaxID=2916755 RepID=UPI00209E211D|nr:glutamate--tRNA ligase [Emticicia sp. 21SJ11W-3]UTA67867.1 glutamate--tRNA ligase [Emticicia sp. 21SJ11W-3]